MRLSVRTASLGLVVVLVACHDAPLGTKTAPPDTQPTPPALFRVVSIQRHISDYPTWTGIQLLRQDSNYQIVGVDFDTDWHRFSAAQCRGTCGQIGAWLVGVPDSTVSCCGFNMGAVLQAATTIAITDGWDSGFEYRTCSAACGQVASWTTTRLAGQGSLGNTDGHTHPLAIDATGTLHLVSRTGFYGTGAFRYAECAASCSDSTNWQSVILDTARVRDAAITTYPTGGAGVAVTLYTGVVRYLTCTTGCLNAANWVAQTIDSASAAQSPSLVLGSDGRPRLTYQVGGGCFEYLTGCVSSDCAYFASCATRFAFCVSSCSSPADWRTVTVSLFGGIDASVALDQNQVPWIAITGLAGQIAGARNSYLPPGSVLLVHCQSGCANPSSWIETPLDSVPGSGWVSMSIDALNRPHIALSGYGIDYAEPKDSISLVSQYAKRR